MIHAGARGQEIGNRRLLLAARQSRLFVVDPKLFESLITIQGGEQIGNF